MNGCGCDQGGLRPVDEAIAELLERAPSPPPPAWVPLEQAQGLTLAEPIHALRPMPAWDNSAMDGYALRARDLPDQGGRLPLAGRIAAGDTGQASLPPGHAARIFTGAPLPDGADAVVPQEQARAEGDGVWLEPCRPGAHVRRRGEEFDRGALIFAAGQRLRAPALGLLASLGVPEVVVHQRLRVGLLSSGDELREPGEVLLPGQIYNANRYSLTGALRSLGLEVEACGVLIDDLAASRDALSQAAAECDVLMTSGGVSVGEEDHLKQAVRELGELNLWRLAIQPGKPFAFGWVRGTPWLGLPGNPVAALLTALVVARPFLLKAQGRRDVLPRAIPIAAGFDWPTANGRRQYLRARLEEGLNGLEVVPHAKQGSAMLTGLCGAEGLAIVEAGRTLARGEPVDFLALDTLLG
ncbi:molybdopterin molybdotransferase MoeA [Pseudomonas paralcaligenes]|uniref:molybdopterin molybdotransferase MoeA n=1 Tax=Pseudomonas paralcaligenes TaxID=2772558 RepID=UPI001C7F0676|nr:gephyrin-like molybdotransferase Glp [Pseudomonas paralcaligenes]